MAIKPKFTYFLLLLSLLIIGCSKPVSTAGGNSAETGNPSIAGILTLWDGSPAVLAQVRCIPPQFNSLQDTLKDSLQSSADSNGYFNLKLPVGTSCALEANHSSGFKMFWPQTITDSSSNLQFAGTLVPPAKLRLGVPKVADGTQGHLVIPGTSFAQAVEVEFGSVFANSVFSTQLARALFISDQGDTIQLAKNIKPAPGTQFVHNSPPIYSEINIPIQTGSSGLKLSSELYNFPYLLRLQSSDLNFDALGAQTPLQIFGKDSSQALAYSINSWDSVQQQVEIWVNIDTLFADTTQNLRLVFDESLQELPSANPFAESLGYLAVWHFDHKAEHLFDHGDLGFDGRPHQIESTPGVVGQAAYFDGKSSYILIPGTSQSLLNFSSLDTLTLSLWVRLDTANTSRFILGKGGFQWHLKYQYTDAAWLFDMRHEESLTGRTYSRIPIDTTDLKRWEHLTIVQKGEEISAYRNGVLINDSTLTGVSSGTKDLSLPLVIGAWVHNDGSYDQLFHGAMDELRIENVARDSTWIRLMYQTTKISDK